MNGLFSGTTRMLVMRVPAVTQRRCWLHPPTAARPVPSMTTVGIGVGARAFCAE